MRVAALYDVHGNLAALDAVLAELEREQVDAIVLGGDVVAGPQPRETLARLRALDGNVVWVRGNHERQLTDPVALAEDTWPIAHWTAAQLTAEEKAWLGALAPEARIDVDGLGSVLFCHATPRSDMELITLVTPDEAIADAFVGCDGLVVAGHTHAQVDRTVGAVRLVNAGSVGMPFEGAPGAYWALLGPEVELRRTLYDVEAAIAAFPAGFPEAEELASESLRGELDRLAIAAQFEERAGR